MKKRYALGVMDLYPIAVMGESVEDSPTVGVELDEKVDNERLLMALNKTVELFPLFKTKIVFDKGYFLQENDNPILIFNEDDYHSTFTWKSGTNDYPWKISFFKNRILLRWCHAITDGRGAEKFLCALLNIYYDIPYTIEPELELGLEPFSNKTEKGIPQKKQKNGFGKRGLKIRKDNNTCIRSHVLKCKTRDVLALSKRSDASPATVIPPLFSMALRECMKRKKNVKFAIVVDARIPLEHKTMHNCIITKEITYIDKFDHMKFELISTIYRTILNLALEKENVICSATDSVNMIGVFTKRKKKTIIKNLAKIFSYLTKNGISDVTFTYLGKIDYGEEVNKHIKNYIFMSWTDFGYCNIAATDLKGEFSLIINEAYQDNQIIKKFIDISNKLGLEIKEVDSFDYRRADR